MKQKLRRSEKLPQHGSPIRTMLLSIVTDLPGYKEALEKGLPLFTKEELDDVKERYKNIGLTWEDIEQILQKKGIFFKKPTFRKYIQEGNLPKSIGYRKSEKGRVAIFPADTISHINFIQYYYKVMDGDHVDNILALFEDPKISYYETIESECQRPNFYASILHFICSGDGDAEVAIERGLKSRPGERDKFLIMLKDIDDKFNNTIRTDIDAMVSLLKKKKISIFEITDDGKETGDE
jgi:hypothetical protein